MMPIAWELFSTLSVVCVCSMEERNTMWWDIWTVMTSVYWCCRLLFVYLFCCRYGSASTLRPSQENWWSTSLRLVLLFFCVGCGVLGHALLYRIDNGRVRGMSGALNLLLRDRKNFDHTPFWVHLSPFSYISRSGYSFFRCISLFIIYGFVELVMMIVTFLFIRSWGIICLVGKI